MGVMYTKVLESWNAKELTDRKKWDNFRNQMIAEFEKLITAAAGPTLRQERYGGTYNMKKAANEGDSLSESIVHYDECVTAAESKVGNLESRLYQLKMGRPPMMAPQQQQMTYYIP